ncbi:MAG: DNA ligase [Gemmataceae bacterium]
MPDLNDGETFEMQGSGSKPYVLKNVGGVYSCSCPAWRNQSLAIEKRTCKHLRKLRGDEAEDARVGAAEPGSATRAKAEKDTNAPPLLLAQAWEFSDPTGWWLSEKLDGVRAYWDGKQFISRLGNLFHAPDWFTAGLPDVPLDGELWIDRKKFQRTVSIVRRQDKSELWKELTYVVFDTPSLEKAFEARIEFVRECLEGKQCAHARPHEQLECHGIEHLKKELARLEELGGEGLMLRKPRSRYEAGRSSTLLKVKSFHDAEARVIKHVPGAGRHKGRLGALMVEMPDGTTFSVGTGFSDKERENPPVVGSVITYRYQELSDGGVPRFPSFVGLREDSPVSEVVKASSKSSAPAPAVISTDAKPKKPAAKAKAAKPAPAAPSEDAESRRFEYTDDKSSKFWEISIDGTAVTVRFGRIGTNGQTQTKEFADAGAAAAHADKLIGEKTEKGYEEVM